MSEDRWTTIAVPILETIRDLEGTHHVDVGEVADRIGQEPLVVATEIERLVSAGFLELSEGRIRKAMTGGNARPWKLVAPRLAERGARVVGIWPSEDPFEVCKPYSGQFLRLAGLTPGPQRLPLSGGAAG